MKFFIIFTAFALANFANADDGLLGNSGLGGILGPLLGGVVAPLTSGLGSGVIAGSGAIGNGVHLLGNALNSAAHGVGDITSNTVAGAGALAHYLPAALWHTLRNAQRGNGAVAALLNTATGKDNICSSSGRPYSSS